MCLVVVIVINLMGAGMWSVSALTIEQALNSLFFARCLR